MWVMSRRVGEKIHVGDEVTVTVLRIAGNRVTLAVDTPHGARILKGECPDVEGEVMQEGGISKSAGRSVETENLGRASE